MTKTDKKPSFLSREQIAALTVSIERRAKTLQADIHKAGASILYHWCDDRKKSAEVQAETAAWAAAALTAIQAASPYHQVAFGKWVSMFTPLFWDTKTKAWTVTSDGIMIAPKAFIAARDTKFWEVSPPAELKPVNLLDLIEKDMEAAKKRRAAPAEKHHEKDLVDLELENRIRRVISEYKTEMGLV
jgi:hypothetical protein